MVRKKGEPNPKPVYKTVRLARQELELLGGRCLAKATRKSCVGKVQRYWMDRAKMFIGAAEDVDPRGVK